MIKITKSIGNKAKSVGRKTKNVKAKVGRVAGVKGVISPEKASEYVEKLMSLVVQVSRNIRKDLPSDMVKAIDLYAEVSFIAGTIGLQVDLEQIPINTK